jgi:hypothetical protein
MSFDEERSGKALQERQGVKSERRKSSNGKITKRGMV